MGGLIFINKIDFNIVVLNFNFVSFRYNFNMDRLNQNIFLLINSLANKNHFLDIVMVAIAKSMPYIFIGLLLYLWFSNRKEEALYSGFATTLGVIINFIIGFIYFHSRPFVDSLGVTLISHKADNSFPSDHTTFLFSIALMLLTFKSTRSLGVISVISALWCGVARVYVGVHYPFDIIASFFVSIVAVTIITLLRNRLAILNSSIIYIWNRIFQ